MGWIENAAKFLAKQSAGFENFTTEKAKIDFIAEAIRGEYEKEFPPEPVKVAFQSLPNPSCRWCGSAAVRNSSMHPKMWTCNDCGKHTEQ